MAHTGDELKSKLHMLQSGSSFNVSGSATWRPQQNIAASLFSCLDGLANVFLALRLSTYLFFSCQEETFNTSLTPDAIKFPQTAIRGQWNRDFEHI